jgi:hypothetical protein
LLQLVVDRYTLDLLISAYFNRTVITLQKGPLYTRRQQPEILKDTEKLLVESIIFALLKAQLKTCYLETVVQRSQVLDIFAITYISHCTRPVIRLL